MRGHRAKRKLMQKDRKYGSVLVARLINKVMLDGKKVKAENIVYSAIENGAKITKTEPAQFLEDAIAKVRPALEIRSRRVGGANYSVPCPVTPARQDALAIRWIIEIARKAQGEGVDKLLEKELVAAFNGEGTAIKKRVEVEKMAEANKAFAHFRW
ncbi:30S ribosomal protein S7 [Candidatus Dojkabacteria bacterium]|jgi:small subunit ribosomal protein S7|nr:30S ribosomal protein S7 [Candidatus Dojkabacteria bacterium]